ncbi:uncharacterized protein LOC141713698 [Apium graveolens]|uniref:uncharacterized protein LOC141713698 n=1 Tax=Apium graveolens TaxID=4045 RepID=UPI003D79588F
MAGEEGDNFFNLKDLNEDYGKEYNHSTRVNRINGQRSYSVNQDEPITSVHPNNSMLTESTPNIVRLVGKRRKLGDLPRLGHLNETAASSASFSRNMLKEETRSNINDVSLNGREPLNRKGKENYLGFGRELFADEIVSDDEEENNDFNEGPNVVIPSFLSDDSEGSDYEASDCESSDDADCLSWSLDGDDEVIVDGMNSDCNLMQRRRAQRRVVPEEYASLGGPTAICSKCHARIWKEERVNKNVTKGCPIFSLCCMKGAVRLPPIPPTPEYLLDLYNDKKRGPTLYRLIRLYNTIFAFTSTGGNIDHSINNGRAPYVYRLNGQNHQVFGSLIPNDNESPKFCQLYIYDAINEVDNRLRWVSVHDRESVDKEVVRGLITMLDETNQLVGEFRQQRDLYESGEIVELQITLKVIRSESGRECHISSTDEVAGIMVGDTEETCGDRDIVVNEKGKGLVRVSYIHPKLMALQYPLLFPRGEDGFHPKIKFEKTADSSCKPRGFLSLKNYYSYTFQIRESDGKTRLWWIRTHQTTLRNELYNNICRSISRGEVDSSNTGKGIVLPAGYVGSKRYMQQNFQDALAKMMEYVPGCIAPNCPDIISRVFKLKLDQLMVDIKDKKTLWCLYWSYVCRRVSEKRPSTYPLLDPVGYAAVKEFMIHGPCGLQNVKSPCMKDLRCIRHFPKKYCARTTFDDSGFPMYMRRRTNINVEIRKAELDNQWAMIVLRFMSREREKGDKNCTFRANEALGKVATREKNKFSKLEEQALAFFYLNSVDVNARKYTYDEIPRFYVWNDGERKWTMRKRRFQIGRLCYVHHSTGEPWFLRLLLMKVRGATSFESLRTVNGVCYSTFRDACKEYDLLDDDKEWHEVLTQASAGGLPPQVRQLFVHIIVNCKVTDFKILWSTHWKNMVDDILLRRHQSCPNTLFTLNELQLQFYALGEIDELLRSVGKSLKKFDQLPQPPRSYLNNGTNNLIIEETSYDTRKMEYETAKLLQDCTEEQRKIYDAVIQSIDTNVGGIFFIYGSGGCGKTFLWRTLICKLRSQGKIMFPVASSGIAAILMPGGRTAHSRFKIPIVLDECSTCNIAHDSDVA